MENIILIITDMIYKDIDYKEAKQLARWYGVDNYTAEKHQKIRKIAELLKEVL